MMLRRGKDTCCLLLSGTELPPSQCSNIFAAKAIHATLPALTGAALLVSVTLQMAADGRLRLDKGLQATLAVKAPGARVTQTNRCLASHAEGLSHA